MVDGSEASFEITHGEDEHPPENMIILRTLYLKLLLHGVDHRWTGSLVTSFRTYSMSIVLLLSGRESSPGSVNPFASLSDIYLLGNSEDTTRKG